LGTVLEESAEYSSYDRQRGHYEKMPSDGGADSRGSRTAQLISARFLYPLCGTVAIFLVLAYCERLMPAIENDGIVIKYEEAK